MTAARLTLHQCSAAGALENLFDQAMENRASSAGTCPQLRVICCYLQDFRVMAAVWQRDVQDPDFLAEHAAYYARWSFPVPRFCSRLHFFSTHPTTDDVLVAIDHWSEVENVYLGFVTLRPLTQSPFGATFLRRPDPAKNQQYIHASHEFPVNLAGRRLSVQATPFMQQDNAVGACAQAAIWMGLRTLRWREGRSAYNPAQITSSATRFVVNGRTLPNRQGLRIEQITEAVRAAGYAPHVLPLRKPEDIRNQLSLDAQTEERIHQQLYPYVESGIPVLLALLSPDGGHAVVVIGHGWQPLQQISPSQQAGAKTGNGSVSIVDASRWARPFLIHNDNTGPYLELPAQSTNGDYALAQAAWAIPLLSAEILVDGEEARTTCKNLFFQLFGQFVDIAINKPIVMRTRLQTRAAFRECALDQLPGGLSRYLRMKWLPAYVWVAIFYRFTDYDQAPKNGACPLSIIVLEPNADPKEGHFLSVVALSALLPATTNGSLVIDRDTFTGEMQMSLIT